ncbi:MAG: trk system potassium uptake protein TrkH [Mariniblastus sp.]|jgi:trk system potassium uptake protein TrkH
MNFPLLSKLLGILTLLLGCFMLFSLIWADPSIGAHTDPIVKTDRPESDGVWGLIYSAVICWGLGGLMFAYGRGGESKIYRKEAMAVVGLSWVLATALGALPYMLSGTCRGPSIRAFDESAIVLVASSRWKFWSTWEEAEPVNDQELEVIRAISSATARGITRRQLIQITGFPQAPEIFKGLQAQAPWKKWLVAPADDPNAPADRASNYRLNWVRMGLIDSLFEAQSGFSTTGATVLCDLEDPHLVPHCILFWRASTHFLGGLGIIVLFVVLLGQGSAGKALMRAEMPGPTQESFNARMQHTAWLFAAMYVGLNVALAIILKFLGMSFFDATCHSFATMATGGFSTYNASLGHFVSEGSNGQAIEYVVILFMFLAGANFTLLFLVLAGNPLQFLRDIEFRTYSLIIVFATAAILVFGIRAGDSDFATLEQGFRNGLFQVVSVMTTTGYGTADFDQWNDFGRSLLLLLMFVGGCAGSTGGGMKVIRHILFIKILRMEVEGSFQPKEVRMLKLGGKATDDQTLRHSILVYFSLISILFVFGFIVVMMFEPDVTWGINNDNKLIDSASAVAATLNNIGPGLGVVGTTQNYSNFSFGSKTLFVWLMMLGRLEIFPILVLLIPRFWRDQ